MALKTAMHNWMRPEPIETTISRLGRCGYDGIEISGEPALYDVKHVRSLLDENGLAWARSRSWSAAATSCTRTSTCASAASST